MNSRFKQCHVVIKLGVVVQWNYWIFVCLITRNYLFKYFVVYFHIVQRELNLSVSYFTLFNRILLVFLFWNKQRSLERKTDNSSGHLCYPPPFEKSPFFTLEYQSSIHELKLESYGWKVSIVGIRNRYQYTRKYSSWFQDGDIGKIKLENKSGILSVFVK